MKGSTYKRCKCPTRYNAQGKRLTCPKKHGTWYFIIDVPLSADVRASTRRQYIKRGGFGSDEAAAELRQVISLLELADPSDDETRLQIAQLIRDHYKRYDQLPAYSDVRRRLRSGLTLAKAKTVGEWLDEWLAGKRKARNTIRSYSGHIRLHLKPHLGDIPLDRLRRIHIQTAYDQILAANATRRRPVSPATIQRIHATLRASLNDAVAEGRLPDNPAVHVELASGKRPKALVWTKARTVQWLRTGEKPKVAVWTPVQAGHFLDYATDDRLYAYYHLLVFRGPRRGEGVGLRWANLDLDGATMDVSEQIIQVGYKTKVSTPKSDSDGLVALDAATVAVLRDHQRQQQAEREAWGEAWTDTGYVFTTELGLPVLPDYTSRHFLRLVAAANKLRPGSQGEAVRDMQLALGLSPTGIYDEGTRRAVWTFQREHGLTPNGIVDPRTGTC